MKPLYLAMQAFGPFPNKEIIDFTALGEHPLFLINGPTGAGKTTLLDAISYALFGKTTGAERQGEQMRCHHAASDTPTEVDLIFAIGAQIYRVSRRPAQQRPKLRGEGVKDDAANATLWQLKNDTVPGFELAEADMTLLASRKVKEVTKRVEQIIGLQADQFRQVVVLPQGKFRELLTADATQREDIFAQLFQTHRYLQIEEQLKDSARDLRQQMRQHEQNLAAIFKDTDVENEQQLLQQLNQLEASVNSLASRKNNFATKLQQRRSAQQHAQHLQEKFKQQQQLQRQQQQLAERQQSIDALRQRLKSARDAQSVAPFVQKRDWLSEQSHQIASQLSEANARCEQRQQEKLDAEQHYQQLQQLDGKNKTLQQRIEQLSRWLPQLDSLTQLKQQVAEVTDKLHGVDHRIQQHVDEKEAIKHRLATETQQLNDIKSTIARHQNIEAMQHQLQMEQQRADKYQQLQSKLAPVSQRLSQLETELKNQRMQTQHAEERSKHMEAQWYQQQALNLAVTLQDNKPCPVCGSCQHPNPANAVEDEIVEHQQLTQAREHYQQQLTVQQHVEQQLLQQKNEHGFITQQLHELGKPPTAATLAQRQTALQATEKQQSQQRTQQQQLEQSVTDAQQQLDAVSETLTQLAAQSHQLQLEQASYQEKLKALEHDIPADFRSAEKVRQTLTRLQQELEQNQTHQREVAERKQKAMEQLATAQAKYQDLSLRQDQLAEQLTDANRALQEQLTAHGFDTSAAYQRAHLSNQDYQQHEQDVLLFEQQSTRVNSLLDELAAELKGQQHPDIDHIQQQLDQAEADHESAHQAWLAERDRLLVREALLTRVKNSKKQAKQLHKRYAVLGTLADVASGQNTQRLSLHRFVLSVLLDDVLAIASQRLDKMTHGRYQLLRESQVSDARSAGGLTILVEDSYTGQQRSTKTLSGGEGFLAALALALGLSDVVQSYAGGIHLDTLFVDEGFGSLDDEALDMAIDTLAELRASGRTIGIISHVRELQDRLADRIDVIRGRNGSRIEMRTQ